MKINYFNVSICREEHKISALNNQAFWQGLTVHRLQNYSSGCVSTEREKSATAISAHRLDSFCIQTPNNVTGKNEY